MIKVVLGFDHAIAREGMRRIIDEEEDMTVVRVVDDGDDLLAAIRRSSPSVVVTDINLAGIKGLDMVRRIRTDYSDMPLVVLTAVDDLFLASHLISSGVNAYLTRCSDAETFLYAIRQAASGGRFVEQSIATQLLYERGRLEADPRAKLTRREFQVFMMVANGLAVKTIAAKLHISPKTVSTHKVRLMNKVGAKNITDLVATAIRSGYLEC